MYLKSIKKIKTTFNSFLKRGEASHTTTKETRKISEKIFGSKCQIRRENMKKVLK